jgi:hypothetical protein
MGSGTPSGHTDYKYAIGSALKCPQFECKEGNIYIYSIYIYLVFITRLGLQITNSSAIDPNRPENY